MQEYLNEIVALYFDGISCIEAIEIVKRNITGGKSYEEMGSISSKNL